MNVELSECCILRVCGRARGTAHAHARGTASDIEEGRLQGRKLHFKQNDEQGHTFLASKFPGADITIASRISS